MADDEKARLYREIVQHASEQRGLERMRLHRFWPADRGLQKVGSDAEALEQRQLPVLHSSHDVAAAMGTTLQALRWLTYHRSSATLVHYHRYSIAKKTGGVRFISAPKPALARAQRWVLEHVLARLEVEPHAH